MPLQNIIKHCRDMGIMVLVDGAHALGMIKLNINALQPDFYIGNCHKWLCAPKGAAFLYTHEKHREQIVPLAISYCYDRFDQSISRYTQLFSWTGTQDPSAHLCVPFAIDYLASLIDGGWTSIYKRNHDELAKCIAQLTDNFPCITINDKNNYASMNSLLIEKNRLPKTISTYSQYSGYKLNRIHPFQVDLYQSHKIQLPIIPLENGSILIRLSFHLYNCAEESERLILALQQYW